MLIWKSVDGDSPLADTESIYPDTSSMTDLAHLVRPALQPQSTTNNIKLRSSHSETMLSQQVIGQDERGSVNSLASACITPGTTHLLQSNSDRFVKRWPVVTTLKESFCYRTFLCFKQRHRHYRRSGRLLGKVKRFRRSGQDRNVRL